MKKNLRPTPGPSFLVVLSLAAFAFLAMSLFAGTPRGAKVSGSGSGKSNFISSGAATPSGEETGDANIRDEESELTRLATGPRPSPAVVEGTRETQRLPTGTGANAIGLILVFGDWANGGWTDILKEPNDSAERFSQALLGDQVEILDQADQGRWSKVKLPSQGDLEGWVRTRHLTVGSRDDLRPTWMNREKYVVTRAPGIATDDSVFLPFGAKLPGQRSPEGDEIRLLLPDGRRAVVGPDEAREEKRPLSFHEALEVLKGFREVAFQEGGNTRQTMDAAGLIYLFLRIAGIEAPRDLERLQSDGASAFKERPKAGDVVFFTTSRHQSWPVILLDDSGDGFIEASPLRGVGFGSIELMPYREKVDVRRFEEPPLSTTSD